MLTHHIENGIRKVYLLYFNAQKELYNVTHVG
jgi:hypothetical protein